MEITFRGATYSRRAGIMMMANELANAKDSVESVMNTFPPGIEPGFAELEQAEGLIGQVEYELDTIANKLAE